MTIDVGASPTQLTRDDLHCPLCNYSLRGLSQPRCPECGHAFDWDALLSAERRHDRDLFEAFPRRNVRAFFRSFFSSFLPRRLFRQMNIAEPFQVRRLILYWLLNLLIVLFGFLALFARDVFRTRSMMLQDRQGFISFVQQDPLQRRAAIRNWGSVANLIAKYKDVTWSEAFNQYIGKTRGPVPYSAMSVLVRSKSSRAALFMLGAVIAWPWLTLLALLLCRTTLKRASINRAHLLRCIVYSCGTSMLLGWIVTLAVLDRIGLGSTSMPILMSFRGVFLCIIFVSAFCPFVTYRLWMAHALYLRLPSSIGMAVSTQLIVLLAMLVCAAKVFGI